MHEQDRNDHVDGDDECCRSGSQADDDEQRREHLADIDEVPEGMRQGRFHRRRRV
jgi:hypothetical protein